MAKSRENGTTILLRLKGYEVGKVTKEGKGIVVEVQTDLKKPVCPCCNSTRLYRHGRAKKRKVLHGWSQGRRVYIEITRQRWRCRECGHSFTGGAELVHPHSRLTRQAETEVLWQLRDRNFNQVKRELGVG